MSELNDTNTELLSQLSVQLELLRKRLPNGELNVIQNNIDNIANHIKQIDDKVRVLQQRILDPETGLAVRVNLLDKALINPADFFKIQQAVDDVINNDIVGSHNNLVSFKKNVVKLLWIIVMALIGIVAKLIVGDFP